MYEHLTEEEKTRQVESKKKMRDILEYIFSLILFEIVSK